MSRDDLRSKYAERIKHFQKAIEQETKRLEEKMKELNKQADSENDYDELV